MVLYKKAFIILLFLANVSTVSPMEIEDLRLKAAQRRIQIIFNHITYPDNDIREEIMNNTTHSTLYAFLASTALMTGTARTMEQNLSQSIIITATKTKTLSKTKKATPDLSLQALLKTDPSLKNRSTTNHPQFISGANNIRQEIDEVKKELTIISATIAILQAQEINNIGKDNSHYNSEENIQTQLIQKNPNQYRLSNASSIKPNTARVEFPIQLSSTSDTIDFVQEENENNSSNIWHSISNTLINSLASLWNSVCTIFAWFKLW